MSDTLTVTLRTGEVRVLEAPQGRSAMEVMRGAGISEIEALCGGSASCATCHVYVDAADYSRTGAMGAAERDLLDCLEHVAPVSRLSCQIPLGQGLGDLHLTVAPEE